MPAAASRFESVPIASASTANRSDPRRSTTASPSCAAARSAVSSSGSSTNIALRSRAGGLTPATQSSSVRPTFWGTSPQSSVSARSGSAPERRIERAAAVTVARVSLRTCSCPALPSDNSSSASRSAGVGARRSTSSKLDCSSATGPESISQGGSGRTGRARRRAPTTGRHSATDRSARRRSARRPSRSPRHSTATRR